jgi:replicative DNA helicase
MKEVKDLFEGNELIGQFGIKYLDDELHGILKSDFILIGARTGAGKSTIANQIAYVNAQNGVKVSLFSLEDYKHDFELTELYKECIRLFKGIDMDYREFKSGIKRYPDDVMRRAYETVKHNKSKMNVVPRKPGGFNIEDMAKAFVDHARAGSQMFVIDHIDYFDLHNPKESENQNITEIMREIRKLQDVYQVPVILISHLKKGMKETIIPTLEDFMGTSNKVKEATMVILLAPDDSNQEEIMSVKRTWISIRKERGLGFFNTVCNIGFNFKTKSYEEDYKIFKVNYWGTKVEGFNNAKVDMER